MVGASVGVLVGEPVGTAEGLSVGEPEGAFVGVADGTADGDAVAAVGLGVASGGATNSVNENWPHLEGASVPGSVLVLMPTL